MVKLGWKKQSHKINPGGISNPIITGENDPGENDPSGDCVWDIILGDIDFIITLYINTHRYVASVSYLCSGSVAQRDLVCESESRVCWVWNQSSVISVIISSLVVVDSRSFVVCDNIIIIFHWAVCVYCLDCEHESWGSQNLESQVRLSKFQGFYYIRLHFSNETFSMSNLFRKHEHCIWYLKLLSCKDPKSWVISTVR